MLIQKLDGFALYEIIVGLVPIGFPSEHKNKVTDNYFRKLKGWSINKMQDIDDKSNGKYINLNFDFVIHKVANKMLTFKHMNVVLGTNFWP